MTPIPTSQLDAGDDSPKLARGSLLLAVTAVNELFSVIDLDTDTAKFLSNRPINVTGGVGAFGLTTRAVTASGVFIGADSASHADITLSDTTSSANNKAARIYTTNGGTLNMGFSSDDFTAVTPWLSVTRSLNVATSIVLAATGLTLSGNTTVSGTLAAGAVTATSFAGSGAGLTALNASNLASGTVPLARLGTGTPTTTTFLRGDNTWQTAVTAVSVASTTGISGTSSGGGTPILTLNLGAITPTSVSTSGTITSGGLLTASAGLSVTGTTSLAAVTLSGNVGIGMAATAPLTVLGAIRQYNKTDGNDGIFTYTADGTLKGGIYAYGTSYLQIQAYAGVPMVFSTGTGAGSEKMRLDANGILAVGTTTPGATMGTAMASGNTTTTSYESYRSAANNINNLLSDGGTSVYVSATAGSTATIGGLFRSVRARGTLAAPTAVQSGDFIGGYSAYAADGGSVAQAMGAIQLYVDTYTASTNLSSYMAFTVRNDGAGLTPAEQMRLTKTGALGIGTTTPGGTGAAALGLGNNTMVTLETYRSNLNNIVNVISDSGSAVVEAIVASTTATTSGLFRTYRTRGTVASPAAVATGDSLGGWNTYAYDGSTGQSMTSIGGFVDTYTAANNLSSYISFAVRNDGTSASNNEVMRLTKYGSLGIGTILPGATASVLAGSTAAVTAFEAYRATTTMANILSDNGSAIVSAVSANATVGNGGIMRMLRSRGTVATPTAVATADFAGAIQTFAFDGSVPQEITAILSYVDTYTAASNLSGYMAFYTRPDGASNPATERMRITKDGRIGINTTSPTSLFSVNGNITAGQVAGSGYDIVELVSTNSVDVRLQAAGNASVGSVGSYSNHPFYIYANGSEAIRITTAGLVGVGTTAPAAKLHVVNGLTDVGSEAHLRIQSSAPATIASTIATTSSAGTLQIFGGASALAGSARGGQIDLLGGGAGGVIQFRTGVGTGGTSQPEIARFDANGNMGIGITVPQSKLHIASTATNGSNITLTKADSGTANQGGNVLIFQNLHAINTARTGGTIGGQIDFQFSQPTSGAAQEGAYILAAADGNQAGPNTPAYLAFGTTGATGTTSSERLRIISTGEVGINRTPAAGTQLDITVAATGTGIRVTGGESGNGLRIVNSTNASGINIAAIAGNGQGGQISTDAGPLIVLTGGGTHMLLDGSGNTIMGGVTAAGTSTATFGHGGNLAITRLHNSNSVQNSQAMFIASSSVTSVAGSAIGGLTWALPGLGEGQAGMMGYIGMATSSAHTVALPMADMIFATRSSGGAAASEKMRLDAAGNLGIGAISAGMKVYVAGTSTGGLGVSVGIDNSNIAGYTSFRLGNGNTGETSSGGALHYMNSSYSPNGPFYANGVTLSSWGANGLNFDANYTGYGTSMIRFHHGGNKTSQFTAAGAQINNALLGYSFLSANVATTASYLIATLPNSTAGTYDQMTIICNLTDNWLSNSNRLMKVSLANRNGFLGRVLSIEGGSPTPAAKIQAYTQSDGSTQIYVVMTTGYYATFALDVRVSQQVALVAYPTAITTVPPGTLAFDSFTAVPNYASFGDTPASFAVNTTTPTMSDRNSFYYNPGAYSAGVNHATGVSTGTAFMYFAYAGTAVGSITQSGTTGTSYNTTSDYRTKTITGPVTASGVFIDSLKPSVGTWNADGSPFVGFVAHEFQEVSPGSVTGNKDDVNNDGTPKLQSMMASSPEVMANIVAEMQDLRKRAASAEAKLAKIYAKLGITDDE